MALDGFPLTKIHAGKAESAEQDQTARMCSLILLCTLRKEKKKKKKHDHERQDDCLGRKKF